MNIIGIRETKFTGKDGNIVEGKTLFLAEPISSEYGTGVTAEKHFISIARLEQMSFIPSVGDDVEPLYNRYGKIHTLHLIEKATSDFDEEIEIE